MDLSWIEDRPEKGLRFTCTQCGHCCCQFPGYVWVTVEEVERIAAFLEMTVPEFGKKYLRRVGMRLSLTEDWRHRCVLLGEDNKCTVYPVRPSQCRSFPFWTSALRSEASWIALKEFCPGTDQGRLHTTDEIREKVERV